MKRGDHLVTERTRYTHHGLYIGDNEVIHYAGLSNNMDKGKIEITSYEDFSQNKNTYIKTHFNRVYNEIESVTRAYSRLGEDEYNLVFNNCEHFVNWCIDGLARSEQVEIALKTLYDYIEEYWKENKDLISQQIIKENLKRDIVSSSIDKTVISNSAGTVAGITTAASALTSGTVLGGAIVTGSVATVAAPLAVAAGVGYGVKKVIDWFWD